MKVLVVGATGETGRRVVETLIAQNIPVRAMVRNLNKGKEILPSDANWSLVISSIKNPSQGRSPTVTTSFVPLPLDPV